MTITKDHIINSVSTQSGLPKYRSTILVNSLLELIKGTLETGEDVLISRFGKFSVKDKRERKGKKLSVEGRFDVGVKGL